MDAIFGPGRRRAIFAAAALGYVLSQFYRSFLTVIVDELQRDLGIGPKEFGALGAAWFIAFSLFQFPVGAALDKLGPRRTVAGLMLVADAGTFVFATASGLQGALLGMVLIGIGCSPVLMGTLYVFAKTEPPARFATLSSLFLACGLLGSLVSATPMTALVAVIGWRHALGAVGVVALLVTVLVALVLRDPPHDAAPADGGLFRDLYALIRAPGMGPILFMSLAVSAAISTERTLWVGPYFGDVHGFDPLQRGNAVLVLSIAMVVSALWSGPLARAINSPRKVVLYGGFFTGSAFLALGLLPGLGAVSALVLIALVGTTGMSYAVLVAHARLFMPAHVIGRGITFVNFLSIGGVGLLQIASGRALEAMFDAGMARVSAYGWLHTGFGLLTLLAAIVYVRSPERP